MSIKDDIMSKVVSYGVAVRLLSNDFFNDEIAANVTDRYLAIENDITNLLTKIKNAPHGRYCAFTTCPECYHFYSSGTGCGACTTGYERPRPCNCWKKDIS